MTYFNANGPKRKGIFRFNRTLTEKEEVTELIDSTWHHNPLDSVIEKLNACRRSIIKWTKEQNTKRNLIISSTQQALEAALSANPPDVPRIEALKTMLLNAYKEEELFWLQRNRIQWLKAEDRNTGFFHDATRKRRVLNTLSVIEDSNGREVFEEAKIASVIAGYFQDIFTTRNQEDFAMLQKLLPNKVMTEMNEYLIRIPSDSEIRDASLL